MWFVACPICSSCSFFVTFFYHFFSNTNSDMQLELLVFRFWSIRLIEALFQLIGLCFDWLIRDWLVYDWTRSWSDGYYVRSNSEIALLLHCLCLSLLYLLFTMEKGGIIPVRLSGKSYMVWSFHLKHFVDGQWCAGYLGRTVTIPTEEKAKAILV